MSRSGVECTDLLDEVMNCWELNCPSRQVTDVCADDISHFMHGWDNYERVRMPAH